MKALVIGGSGFIGSHLVDQLTKLGWDVVVLDIRDRRSPQISAHYEFMQGDLSQTYLLREAMAGVDVIYHLAWATIHETSNLDPGDDVRINLLPSIQLIQTALNQGIPRIVFTSSGGTVYGPTEALPIVESHPTNPINSYGITKLAVEKYLQMFHHLNELDYAILRPSVPYGPGQNPLSHQGAVAVFLYRVANDLPITIWGDGSITRDFFYISDLIDALLRAGTRNLAVQRIFNIGGPEEISLNSLIEKIEQVIGKRAVVEFQPARPFDSERVVLDTNLAKAELGWQPKVYLPDGLARTWSWLKSSL